MATQRCGECGNFTRIALVHAQAFASCLKFFRRADERRDLVAARERLIDELPTGPAGCTEDEQSHGLAFHPRLSVQA